MVQAHVLGGAENSFRQALLGWQGDLSVCWSNWLVGSITALSMVMFFWPLISKVLHSLFGRRRRPAPV